jgi:hypothetical protein
MREMGCLDTVVRAGKVSPMLARHVLTVALFCALAPSAGAQITGHYPGPKTRYEWNPSPYSNSYGNSSSGSYGRYAWQPNRGSWHGRYRGGGYAWPGYVGPIIVSPFGGVGYGYGYAQPYGYGYADGWYGPQWPPSYTNYGYSPVNPFVIPGGTIDTTPNLPAIPEDPAVELEQILSEQQQGITLTPEERLQVLKPSTPEAQQTSLRRQASGDQHFHELRYAAAAQEYRLAIQAAADLPDNYFRLGFALAAMRRYEDAVDQFRYGLILDPTWPQRGESLESIWGEGNQFERRAAMHRVADWVRGDLRNADRIFLLAVFLHFDGDQEKSRSLIESAIRVAGHQPYLEAFLNGDNAAAAPAQQPAEDQPLDDQPADNQTDESVPAPPPAGIAPKPRTRPAPVPNPPEAQKVPQRTPAPTETPDKFPELKSPGLPGESPAEEPEEKGDVTVTPPESGPSLPTLN